MLWLEPSYFSDRLQPGLDVLVGSDEAVKETTAAVSADVQSAALADVHTDDLYSALAVSMTERLRVAVADKCGTGTAIPGSLPGMGKLELISMAANGATGVETGVMAVKAVGDLYQAYADCPQDEVNVRRSQAVALGHVLGVANSDGPAARRTTVANHLGVDPNLRRYEFLLRCMKKRVPAGDAEIDRAFEVHDPKGDGQLAVALRHRRLPAQTDRVCPAALNKVESGEAKKPALWLFLNCIGTVALQDIYPRQFDIRNRGGTA